MCKGFYVKKKRKEMTFRSSSIILLEILPFISIILDLSSNVNSNISPCVFISEMCKGIHIYKCKTHMDISTTLDTPIFRLREVSQYHIIAVMLLHLTCEQFISDFNVLFIAFHHSFGINCFT